jgi:ABC-type molybdate transport system permease subunit
MVFATTQTSTVIIKDVWLPRVLNPAITGCVVLGSFTESSMYNELVGWIPYIAFRF